MLPVGMWFNVYSSQGTDFTMKPCHKIDPNGVLCTNPHHRKNSNIPCGTPTYFPPEHPPILINATKHELNRALTRTEQRTCKCQRVLTQNLYCPTRDLRLLRILKRNKKRKKIQKSKHVREKKKVATDNSRKLDSRP